MSKENKGLVPKLRFPEFEKNKEWAMPKLSSLGFFTGGGTPSKAKEDYWMGANPWVSSSDISEDDIQDIAVSRYISDEAIEETATKIVPANSILLVSRVGVGKLAVTREPICTSQDFTNFTPFKDNLLFLAYSIKSLKNKLLALNQGMAIKGFTKDDVANLVIPLPEDKDEQQKIADCLSSLDALIGAQADKVDALKTHKKALMQQLFPREGETVPRMRFPDFQHEDDWKEYTIEEVAGFRRGSFPQPYGLPEWYDDENGFPFIQVFDVSDDMRLKSFTKRKISALAAEQSVFIKKGTLIITIQGSIGRVAVTQYDAYIDRTLLIFQNFKKPIEKLFFAYVIQMLFEIERHNAPGGIIKTITKESLSSFIVKLPSKDEQQKIADCLSSLDELIAAEADKLDALKTHKKGLMQQLFPVLDEVAV